jgi:hypothetical protein
VARCTKIINAGADDAKYMINLRQYAKFVVALGDKVAPTDVEEGMRVGASACGFEAAWARLRPHVVAACAIGTACACMRVHNWPRLCASRSHVARWANDGWGTKSHHCRSQAIAPPSPLPPRAGVERNKYSIQIPLPPRIDPSVTMMTVEEKPDVTYDDVGGAGESLEKLREVVELPLLHPERFVTLGIDPPKVRCAGRRRECARHPYYKAVAARAAAAGLRATYLPRRCVPRPYAPAAIALTLSHRRFARRRSPRCSALLRRCRACCCTARPARARRCPRARWRTGRTPASSA